MNLSRNTKRFTVYHACAKPIQLSFFKFSTTPPAQPPPSAQPPSATTIPPITIQSITTGLPLLTTNAIAALVKDGKWSSGSKWTHAHVNALNFERVFTTLEEVVPQVTGLKNLCISFISTLPVAPESFVRTPELEALFKWDSNIDVWPADPCLELLFTELRSMVQYKKEVYTTVFAKGLLGLFGIGKRAFDNILVGEYLLILSFVCVCFHYI